MSAQIKNLGNTQAKTACSWDYKDYKCVQRDPKISSLCYVSTLGLFYLFKIFLKKIMLNFLFFFFIVYASEGGWQCR